MAGGTLTAQETPAGLLLLRDRGDHTRLHFFLEDLSVPLGAALPDPTVTEVAYRPRDKGLREAVDYLIEQGFTPLFERLRLSPSGRERRERQRSLCPALGRSAGGMCWPFCRPTSLPSPLPAQ